VIFASDNGPWLTYGDHAGSAGPLREGKGTCWEGGVRVPCIMRWPCKIPAGTTSDTMLMTIDMLPTLAKLIGGRLPDHKIDGLDVGPILWSDDPNETRNPHDYYYYYNKANELQAVCTGDGRWKLQLPHSYRSVAGKRAGRGGQAGPEADRAIYMPELYDLSTDVGERKNVAVAEPKMMKKLLDAAEQIRAELGDSLLKRTGTGAREPGLIP